MLSDCLRFYRITDAAEVKQEEQRDEGTEAGGGCSEGHAVGLHHKIDPSRPSITTVSRD